MKRIIIIEYNLICLHSDCSLYLNRKQFDGESWNVTCPVNGDANLVTVNEDNLTDKPTVFVNKYLDVVVSSDNECALSVSTCANISEEPEETHTFDNVTVTGNIFAEIDFLTENQFRNMEKIDSSNIPTENINNINTDRRALCAQSLTEADEGSATSIINDNTYNSLSAGNKELNDLDSVSNINFIPDQTPLMSTSEITDLESFTRTVNIAEEPPAVSRLCQKPRESRYSAYDNAESSCAHESYKTSKIIELDAEDYTEENFDSIPSAFITKLSHTVPVMDSFSAIDKLMVEVSIKRAKFSDCDAGIVGAAKSPLDALFEINRCESSATSKVTEQPRIPSPASSEKLVTSKPCHTGEENIHNMQSKVSYANSVFKTRPTITGRNFFASRSLSVDRQSDQRSNSYSRVGEIPCHRMSKTSKSKDEKPFYIIKENGLTPCYNPAVSSFPIEKHLVTGDINHRCRYSVVKQLEGLGTVVKTEKTVHAGKTIVNGGSTVIDRLAITSLPHPVKQSGIKTSELGENLTREAEVPKLAITKTNSDIMAQILYARSCSKNVPSSQPSDRPRSANFQSYNADLFRSTADTFTTFSDTPRRRPKLRSAFCLKEPQLGWASLGTAPNTGSKWSAIVSSCSTPTIRETSSLCTTPTIGHPLGSTNGVHTGCTNQSRARNEDCMYMFILITEPKLINQFN